MTTITKFIENYQKLVRRGSYRSLFKNSSFILKSTESIKEWTKTPAKGWATISRMCKQGSKLTIQAVNLDIKKTKKAPKALAFTLQRVGGRARNESLRFGMLDMRTVCFWSQVRNLES